MAIIDDLRAMRDDGYRAFNAALVPNVDPSTMLGVRVPRLRAYAKALARRDRAGAEAFMERLPHAWFEENMLHGILIGLMAADQPQARALMDDPEATWRAITAWAASGHPYTVRFAVDELMIDYLDERFRPGHLAFVAGIGAGEYYVDMARAWYFATALTKQWDAAIRVFEPGSSVALDDWTHNKSIQKARESRRIDPERKTLLASLRRPAGRVSGSA